MRTLQSSILGEAVAVRSLDDANIRLIRYRAGQEMRLHAHNWMSVTLVVSGSLRDMVEGRTAVCRPLTLVVKPESAEHATCVGPGGALTINFELTALGVRTLARLGVDMSRCGFFIAGSVTSSLLNLLRRDHADQTVSVSKILADGILYRSDSSPPVDTATVSELARCSSHASTQAAADSADMHPVSFARRFRRLTGVSPSKWRLHHRVAQAAGGLAAGNDSISNVAHAAGFADQAHLCRMFRRETGLTPGRYRALVQTFHAESR